MKLPELIESRDVIRSSLNGTLPRRDFLAPFSPKHEFFPVAAREAILHQRDHAGQVVVLTALNIALLRLSDFQISEQDAVAALLASSYHDSEREHDGDDPEHGERAAGKVLQNDFTHVPPHLKPLVARIIREHVPHDTPDMHPLTKIVKDSDGLLFQRTGDFDEGFVRLPTTQMLIPVAAALIDETNNVLTSGIDGFEAALVAASNLGLLH